MKKIKWKAVLSLVLASVSLSTLASAAPPQCSAPSVKVAGGGASDVGHGDGSVNGYDYQADSFYGWCAEVAGWISDVQMEANGMLPMEGRAHIVRQVEKMLRAYRGGKLPMEPMTYSLLQRIKEIDAIFPYCEWHSDGEGSSRYNVPSDKGNGSAILVLSHLLDVAKNVNQNFDVNRWLDFASMNPFPRCGEKKWNDELYETCSPMYLSYIQSARLLLSELFGEAHANSPGSNVFDAMGADRWELQAMERISRWLAADVARDIFGRRFDCVRGRLVRMNQDLHAYLGRTTTNPYSDRRKRVETRARLGEVLAVLDTFGPNYQWGSCGN